MAGITKAKGRPKAYKCLRCNHVWTNRPIDGVYRKPRLCPSCKSVNWDVRRRSK